MMERLRKMTYPSLFVDIFGQIADNIFFENRKTILIWCKWMWIFFINTQRLVFFSSCLIDRWITLINEDLYHFNANVLICNLNSIIEIAFLH